MAASRANCLISFALILMRPARREYGPDLNTALHSAALTWPAGRYSPRAGYSPPPDIDQKTVG
jgi:hypothetical protein